MKLSNRLILASIVLLLPVATSFSFRAAGSSGTRPINPQQQQWGTNPLLGRNSLAVSTTGSEVRCNLFTSDMSWQDEKSNMTRRKNSRNGSTLNNRYSASDWLHNVKSLPRSSVLREIRNPVITISIWGAFVSILHKILALSTRSSWQKAASDICIGSQPHSFLMSALGLLLVFRTNSAYQRFVEGRKIWEQILSTSRNLSRFVTLYEKEIGSDRKERVLNLLAAYPYLLRHHIRPRCLDCNGNSIEEKFRLKLHERQVTSVETRHEGDKTNGETTLPEQEWDDKTKKLRECWVDRRKLPWSLLSTAALEKCAQSLNRPLWVCDRLGRELMSIPYGPNFTSRERLSLLGQIDKLNNCIGECERIHQTAVPLNYARHSLRSLTLWLLTLPFALIKDLGLLTGPVMGATAWLLFGVYQIGYSIEDPFQRSLRLSILCDAIRRDVLGETTVRYSAFSLDDTWEQEEEDLSLEGNTSEKPKASKKRKLKRDKNGDDVGELDNFSPLSPDLLNSTYGNLNIPQLVKESGSWNVVGVVEG